MNGIIKHDEYSYRITNEPEPNRDNTVFVFNGIRLDRNGNKTNVKMLFVRRDQSSPEALKAHGAVERVCVLPEPFYDERFHKRYLTDSSSNSSFDLYICARPRRWTNGGNGKKRALTAVIIIAVIALLLLLAFAALIVAGFFRKGEELQDQVEAGRVSSSAGDTADDKRSLGDLNGDGQINAKDASIVLADYMKLSIGEELSEREMELGDVNRDGKYDSSDASFILGYYNKVSTGKDITLSEYYEEYVKNSSS